MTAPGIEMWIASHEEAHEALFRLFREAGWRPGQPLAGGSSDWVSAALHFPLHDLALRFVLELGGVVVSAPRPPRVARFAFAPGQAFHNLRAAAADYDRDVRDILAEDAFPVGEAEGKVLFVAGDGRAALIDQSLCGFVRAPDPFLLLDWFLFERQHESIELQSVPFGERVTGRPFP